MRKWAKKLALVALLKVFLGVVFGIGFWAGRRATIGHYQPIVANLMRIVEQQETRSAPVPAPAPTPTPDQISKGEAPRSAPVAY